MNVELSCLTGRVCVGLVCLLLFAAAAPAQAAEESDDVDTEALYGSHREPAVVEHLRAGPIRLKFQDGELRYLYVGNREIVRRVYFAVRDRHWDTVMPAFSRVEVQDEARSFRIRLEALCKSDSADYAWTGEIRGEASGEITFEARGKAGSDFRSPRIGLCVLYGAEDLAGQSHEVAAGAGRTRSDEFPREVSASLLQKAYRSLRYETPDGMGVRVGLKEDDFLMEDQRTYGDSSYKAYAPMDYEYPQIKAGQEARQVLTISVSDAPGAAAPEGPVRISIGQAIEGRTMPRITRAVTRERRPGFGAINRRREQHADAESLGWSYCPALHLPDDDTFMENLPAIVDQVRTVRTFAPDAAIRIGRIGINAPYPRSGPDPRNRGQFAAAWAVGLTRYLALAGVDEAAFALGPGPVDAVLKVLAEDSGRAVRETSLQGRRPLPVEALALGSDEGAVLWLANTTDFPQEVSLDLAGRRLSVSHRFGASLDTWVARREGQIVYFTLKPLEVSRLPIESARQ